jgi:hypothetical protein
MAIVVSAAARNPEIHGLPGRIKRTGMLSRRCHQNDILKLLPKIKN